MKIKHVVKMLVPKSLLFFIQQRRINLGNYNKTCQEVFSDVYKKSLWGKSESDFCSGSGSMIKYTTKYKDIIDELVNKHNITTIVDLGCGDYQIGKIIKPEKVKYIGVDIVKELIAHHQNKYQDDFTEFVVKDIVNDDIPDGELCLIRQVLQHLSNEQIIKIISQIKKYDYCLITEHFPSPEKYKLPNLNIIHGAHTRVGLGSAVCLSKPPFNLKNIVEVCQIDLEKSWDDVESGECLKIFLIDNKIDNKNIENLDIITKK